MVNLIWVELKKRVTAVIGWGIGIGAYLALILSVSPELAPMFGDIDLASIPIYQMFGLTENTMMSIAGLVAVYVSFIGVTIAVYGVITGVNALAGEEDDGTLEVLLALPLARWQIVAAKTIAISIAIFAILVVAFLGYLFVFPAVEAEIGGEFGLLELFLSTVEAWPLTFMFATLALFLGAYLPRRSHALAVSLGVLLGSYLFNNLAQQAGPLKELRQFLPFYYSVGGDVLRAGLDWEKMALLTGVGLLFFALALLSFQRRNVTVGAWPWVRPARS
jgi:ABC-2 type transport system permease protein